MKLLYRKNVSIPKEKLTDYLLSVVHPDGKSKAKLFREWGYDETNINKLEEDLRKIATRRKVVSSRPSAKGDGINYVVDGKMAIPKGGIRPVRTVWFTSNNQKKPRLVTAYPLK